MKTRRLNSGIQPRNCHRTGRVLQASLENSSRERSTPGLKQVWPEIEFLDPAIKVVFSRAKNADYDSSGVRSPSAFFFPRERPRRGGNFFILFFFSLRAGARDAGNPDDESRELLRYISGGKSFSPSRERCLLIFRRLGAVSEFHRRLS